MERLGWGQNLVNANKSDLVKQAGEIFRLKTFYLAKVLQLRCYINYRVIISGRVGHLFVCFERASCFYIQGE